MGRVFIARIALSIAALDGRAWAGERLTGEEIQRGFAAGAANYGVCSEPRPILEASNRASSSPGLARLLAVANRHGREAVLVVWEEYERRWTDAPETLPPMAITSVGCFRDRDNSATNVIQWLHELEDRARKGMEAGDAPRELTSWRRRSWMLASKRRSALGGRGCVEILGRLSPQGLSAVRVDRPIGSFARGCTRSRARALARGGHRGAKPARQ